jgi:RNA recognition motif-containing protein
MGKKLFVGGLPYATTEDRLHEVFESYGPVTEAKIVLERETNRPRGFGFVTFEEEADAQKAMAELDRSDFDGRTISVQPATERSSGGGGGERRGPRPGGGRPPRRRRDED